jgi:two-component system phosphate regulon sensor histidine kinase PhoR
MRGLSYVQKIVIPYLVLMALSLLAIGVSSSQFFEEFELPHWQQELAAEAQLISIQITEDLAEFAAGDNLSPYAVQYKEITGNRVTIISEDGTVAGESDYLAADMENHLERPEVQAALKNQNEPSIRMSATLRERLIYVATPVYQNGDLIGVVRLAKSLAEFDSTVNKLRTLLWIVAGISLAVSILFMMLQSSKLLNPLRKISEKIHQASEGELRVIEGKERRDEIGLVVAAHNAQVEKSQRQIQELMNERTKLAAILFNMSDGVILVNARGDVTLINPTAQKMFSYGLEANEGESLIEVVRQHQILELWQETVRTGKSQSTIIETSLDKENIQVISSLLGAVLPGEVLLLFQDLTLMRKLETVRKDFVSNISHELRTPLASLKALSETLQGGALQDPKVSKKFLQQMDVEIDNLNQMVMELLELAKIESGKVPFEKKIVTVAEVINRPIERMRLQAERSGLSIESRMEGELPSVQVDLPRIQQVLINLIHNAIKFTPPGGKISIVMSRENELILFRIADSGIGIPANELERIFERFYKSDRSRSGGGTGLGLSISRHIIEAHGGKIWAKSDPGKGSEFCFTIRR